MLPSTPGYGHSNTWILQDMDTPTHGLFIKYIQFLLLISFPQDDTDVQENDKDK